MKIQIAATVFADGFLSPISYQSQSGFQAPKYSISALRKKADLLLSKNESVISLLNQKQNKVPITYFAEATPDMLDLIKVLWLYRLVDELYVFMLPENKSDGIRLFDFIPQSELILIEKYSLYGGGECLVYQLTKLM